MADSEDALTNEDVARLLSDVANLLEQQRANEYRIKAYRNAARAAAESEADLGQLYRDGGTEALTGVPGIGESLARVIADYLATGRSPFHEQLQAELDPRQLFADLPGIGPELAGNIVEELGVRTLEELEAAARDGRLGQVSGFGPERVETVRDLLKTRLDRYRARRHGRSAARHGTDEAEEAGRRADETDGATRQKAGRAAKSRGETPSDELLLAIDRDYRKKAEAGELRRIAPRRFNPEGKAWLPVYETERAGWRFTALYSNTAKAHEQNKTHDWVVIYWESDAGKGQNTVVTGSRGQHAGTRVVLH